MGSEIVRNILLNATTSGFDTVGNTLLELGAELDGVSSKLINFGRDSLSTYKDYQYNMQQARIAQSVHYGQETALLDEQMKKLDEHASKWAKETMFHTNDVSNAILLASRASMNAEEIINVMPHMFELAKAGGIDLSQAVDMVVKSCVSLGLSKEDISDFTDMWVYSANASTGSVQEFGDTILRLSSTGRFADTKEELFSLIALMHNMGSTGSQAGTMLRTTWMRLIAPTGVTSSVLKMLGATKEEYESVRDDFSKTEAFKWLSDKGFSAYDAQGKLKPLMQAFGELRDLMIEEAGSFEDIGKNQTTLGVLGAIFGTRGITGALNTMYGLNDALELQNALLGGAAEGYGEYAMKLMEATFFGNETLYESKIEELKRHTGETLAPRIEQIRGTVGEIVDMVSGLDTASFDALVGGLTTIAGLGGGLTVAGLAFKLIANLMTPTGAIAATMAAFAAGAAALEQFKEAKFAEGFGLGDLDSRQVMDFVTGLGEDFTAAYKEIEKFNSSMETAITEYTKVSGTFSTDLLSLVLTGTQITPEQQSSLENLGVNMYKAVVQGITDSKDASLAYWNMLFGGEENAENMDLVEKLIGSGYQDMLDQAATINQDIKSVMMKGFEEGFDESDYNKILDFMRQYNELVARATAEAQREQDFIDQQLLLHKAQTASLADTDALAQEVIGTRDANLAKEQETHLRNLARLQYYYENGIAYNGQVITDAQYQTMVAAANAEHEKRMLEYRAQNDRVLAALWNTQITQSEYGAGYSTLSDIASKVISGEVGIDQAMKDWRKSGYGLQRQDIMQALALSLEPYGGPEGAISQILEYRRNGMAAEAGRLTQLLTMQLLNSSGNMAGVSVQRNSGILGWLSGDYSFPQSEYTSGGARYRDVLSGLLGFDAIERARELGKEYAKIGDWINEGLAEGMKGSPAEEVYLAGLKLKQQRVADEVAALTAEYKKYFSDTTALGQAVTEGMDSAKTGGGGSHRFEVPGEVKMTPNTSLVDSYKPPTKYGTVIYNTSTPNSSEPGKGNTTYYAFADGGRTTVPSIFGEGGIPEWAIPEEHTDRTAELLNAARAASGFTWPEILSRYGGLNANANHTPTTIVYSPTINANDVTGVREALNEDKRRMERWLEDKKLHDEIEVYA